MADFAWFEFDHWVCVVHQHDGWECEQSETGFLADVSAFPNVILCVEFFGVGEGKRVHSDFFAEADGDRDCRGFVPELVHRCACAEGTEKAIGGCGI